MMENLPENNSGQGNNPAAKKSSSTGSMLREAREDLGLTVADVAGQIKFAPRQIEALEADDFKHLPEAAFLRGFVRSYAKILKLDAESLLANMPSAKTAAAELIPSSVDVPFPSEQDNRQQNLVWLGAASVLAVLVLGLAFWHYKSPLKQPKELAKAQTTEPINATPVEAPGCFARRTQIQLRARRSLNRTHDRTECPSCAEIPVGCRSVLGQGHKDAGFSA